MTLLSEARRDFTAIVSDLGRTVSYEAVTITENNISGDEIKTYAAATNKTWIFLKHSKGFDYEKSGFTERGDAYLMIPRTDSLKYGDKVTVDGETYEVTHSQENYIQYFGGGAVHIYATLAKKTGDQT